jgi:hypothetical protein
VNHQNLLSRLSTGLCQVADLLPRAELILQLYPTEQIKHSIVAMYTYILRFLLRALRWYQESKQMRVIHAITRPAELRYDDLLEKISSLSRSMTEFALVISHAEQRDLHNKIQQHLSRQQAMEISIEQLTALVAQLKESISTEQVVNASARIEFRQSLSEIQLAQFITLLSVTMLPDPFKTFQASLFMRNRRRLKPSNSGPHFWLDPKMQIWNRSQSSSLAMIHGTRKLRFHIRDFCTNSISMLRNSKTPVIWALKVMDTQETIDSGAEGQVSTIELLKYIISQAVRVNEAIHTDAALTPRLKAYMNATTEDEWLKILASVLQGIPLLYIIIDVELLDNSLAELTEDFSWPAAFLKLFSQLAVRNIKTVIKIALVSYGSPLFKQPMSTECQKLIVPVGGIRPGRALMRIPNGRGHGSTCGRKREPELDAGRRCRRRRK